MTRKTTLLALLGSAMLTVATAAQGQTTYQCNPDEQRVRAYDRLVSVEVVLNPDGSFSSVIYRAANGAVYDRSAQYASRNGYDPRTGHRYWVGTLRANPSVRMIGTLVYDKDDQATYYETIYDRYGGRVVGHVTSYCEPVVAKTEPAPPAPAPAPAPAWPSTESDAFMHCVNTAVVVLSAMSHEPAETIVDAALGECPKEHDALYDALERAGYGHSAIDEFTKNARPVLLALVLNTRADAELHHQAPANGELP